MRLAAVAGVDSACATGACTGNVTLAEVRQCSSCRNATVAGQHAWRLCIAEFVICQEFAVLSLHLSQRLRVSELACLQTMSLQASKHSSMPLSYMTS